MNIALPLLTFLIPAFGIISGLSASVSVPIFAIAVLYAAKNKIVFPLKNYKLEALFLIWLALSCSWSPHPHGSVAAFLKIMAVISLGVLSCANVQNLKLLAPKIELSVILGVAAALSLFFIELLSGGVISNTFRLLFQSKNNQEFLLHFLDRGCAILALTSWLIIGIFLKYKKHILAAIYYFFIIFTLASSDNMAGFISFALAGIVFLLTRSCLFLRNPKIVCGIFISVVLAMILFFLWMNPKSLADKAESLPLSAKHRLFIWNFVADKAMENPYTGSGFFSSKFVSSQEHGFIEYGGETLSLFPLHPHNNILQIFFETGLIGLALFIAALCKYLFIIGKNYRTNNAPALDLISVSYSCFATYMGIAMISYSVWQSWWVCAALWITIMFRWLLQNKEVL
jgi:O-antigen ligase